MWPTDEARSTKLKRFLWLRFKARKLLGHSSTRQCQQVPSSLGHHTTNEANVLLTGILTDPAFLILFLSFDTPLCNFTSKRYMFTLKWKDEVVGLTAWLSCMSTGNDEIMNADYNLDDQYTLTDLSQGKTRCFWSSLCMAWNKNLQPHKKLPFLFPVLKEIWSKSSYSMGIYIWEYIKTDKSILRPPFDQSNCKKPSLALMPVKWHIIILITK